MKKYLTILISSLCATSAAFADTLLVEGEDFQFIGDWQKEQMPHSRQKDIGAGMSRFSPLTVIDVKKEGSYDVWASSYDFADKSPRSRFYTIDINDKPLPNRAGVHGRDGFYWEKIGTVDFTKGDQLIQLRVGNLFCRCDALIFTTDKNFNPNEVPNFDRQRKKFKIAPKQVKYRYEDYFADVKPLEDIASPKTVELANKDYKIVFTQKKTPDGKIVFERGAELLKDGKWVKLEAFKDELFFTQYAKNINYRDTSYFSMWNKTKGKSVAKINGKERAVDIGPSNPYAVGDVSIMRAISVEKKSDKSLEVKFDNGAVALMTLPEKGQIVKIDMTYKAPKDGFYGIGFKSFNEVKKEAVLSAFMPTPYQGKRLMSEPRMMTTTLMSQPVSMIQSSTGDFDVTSGVIGNPDCLPFEWSIHGRAVYGFSLASHTGTPQAVVFQPIIGGEYSKKKAGEVIKSSWYAINMAGDWRDAFEYFNSNIFAAKNIRESFNVSFSDALANIGKYMKHEKHSGWAPKHKARWNIEGDDLVTHASPMAEVEVALLTNDEEYYKNIALPTIEYTLTRKGAHFRTFRTDILDYGSALHELKVPGDLWQADYFASLDVLLGSKNKWLYEFTKRPDGKMRFVNSTTPAWCQKLGYYMVNPSPELLEEIKNECDAWIKSSFEARYSYEPNFVSFINYGLYPYWWYLPEMYKATGDKKYLDYAEKGAFFTLSSLWNFPTLPAGEVVINKDNLSNGIGHIWWKGREPFRQGAEISMTAVKMLKEYKKDIGRNPFLIPEKKVDAEIVSRIGVGIEQHSTYMGGCSNIVMPGWSNEMLKVSQLTGRDILMKFSRHAIVGRFANFFGYYICSFSDIMQDEDYPYSGPDITSFYYHHAPCHFAQTADYLFTQIEVATNNKISFPYVRQQGYVWFTDRIFGMDDGKVFDDENCRPILDKQAVRPDSPKVSTLLARSKNSIWAIVYNDSSTARKVKVSFDPLANVMKDAIDDEPVALYNSDGVKLDKAYSFFGDKFVDMKPFEVVAFKIPAKAYANKSAKLEPLGADAHYKQAKTADNWGEFHAFRIRGPFGKDSVYVMFTNGFDAKKAKIVLNMESENGNVEVSRDYFPYEISIYPISPKKDIVFTVSVFEDGNEVYKTEKITLKK